MIDWDKVEMDFNREFESDNYNRERYLIKLSHLSWFKNNIEDYIIEKNDIELT
jgi:hypothetical protein